MKYMHALCYHVERKIASQLPDKFALVHDGWSHGSTHYLAIFATFPSSDPIGYTRTAAIVKNPEFEDGVVNALLGSEASLTSVEADAIKALRDSQASQGSEEGFAVLVLSLAERSVS
ncbi:hypothetical protein H257_01991 [Aphanomyces astaci]|uniref:Uncharacterized protein n=1 Tax=Aphanomyces astaci TaxID=112090 RepID=W4H782_APHAT|nr:hypothetical protein H257_01991 [Aphanomyces astaci]ETV86973.1 hypothetical protein H257_01991 [Aphanomyces astaci]|eukprot:XP_009823772.1 hypothetical protein H257_01991 [Aphanomyces astaci]